MARAVVRGDRELATSLRSVGRFSATEMDQICIAALTPIQVRTVENAFALRDETHNPPGGHLDQGVVIAKTKASSGYRQFWVSFSKRARKLAHLVEFGTNPHYQPHYRGGFMHPGARSKPFFRPAFEAEKVNALQIFGTATYAVIVKKIAMLKRPS